MEYFKDNSQRKGTKIERQKRAKENILTAVLLYKQLQHCGFLQSCAGSSWIRKRKSVEKKSKSKGYKTSALGAVLNEEIYIPKNTIHFHE